jgi:hypothetical protein
MPCKLRNHPQELPCQQNGTHTSHVSIIGENPLHYRDMFTPRRRGEDRRSLSLSSARGERMADHGAPPCPVGLVISAFGLGSRMMTDAERLSGSR